MTCDGMTGNGKGVGNGDTIGDNLNVMIINESGLYKV
jgi:prophage antirepressor-like protein